MQIDQIENKINTEKYVINTEQGSISPITVPMNSTDVCYMYTRDLNPCIGIIMNGSMRLATGATHKIAILDHNQGFSTKLIQMHQEDSIAAKNKFACSTLEILLRSALNMAKQLQRHENIKGKKINI